VVLSPLVVVLAICRSVFTFWRIQAKSVAVPAVTFIVRAPCVVSSQRALSFGILEKEVKSDVTATGKYPAEACSDRYERERGRECGVGVVDSDGDSRRRFVVMGQRERERASERGVAHSEAQRGEKETLG